VDPKRLEQIKALYGFDKPAHERFCRCWASSRVRPGQELLPEQGRVAAGLEKLPVSISLGLWTFFISYLVACRWAWPRRCAPARV
jgi:microcin C transport system permease protein